MSVAPCPEIEGVLRFARYASPPNLLGYCGPAASTELGEMLAERAAPDLGRTAREFLAAWPYLELLAGAAHCDPLSDAAVEAYWIGNRQLSRVSVAQFGGFVDERFRHRAGSHWQHLVESVSGGVANHAFHVLVASPWVGLMREGIVDEPLAVVDRCRISWGRVVDETEQDLEVVRRPLEWHGGRLVWGEPVVERVVRSSDPAVAARIGDVVSLHWGTVCDVLTPGQERWLAATTASQLRLVERIGRPC